MAQNCRLENKIKILSPQLFDVFFDDAVTAVPIIKMVSENFSRVSSFNNI